jgi:hypothetical protein
MIVSKNKFSVTMAACSPRNASVYSLYSTRACATICFCDTRTNTCLTQHRMQCERMKASASVREQHQLSPVTLLLRLLLPVHALRCCCQSLLCLNVHQNVCSAVFTSVDASDCQIILLVAYHSAAPGTSSYTVRYHRQYTTLPWSK